MHQKIANKSECSIVGEANSRNEALSTIAFWHDARCMYATMRRAGKEMV